MPEGGANLCALLGGAKNIILGDPPSTDYFFRFGAFSDTEKF